VSLRRALAASQIALSLVLLVGALLFVKSLRNLTMVDPGFETRGILIADMDFWGVHLTPRRVISFRREILERVRAIHGVEAAAEATIVPLTGGNWNNRMWMNGQDSARGRVAMRSMIGAGYFLTLKTPLLAGREFDQRDEARLSKIAVVNQEFARQFCGSMNAIGQHFWIESTPYEPETAYEIVGVVKNTKYSDLRQDFQPLIFTPLTEVAQNRSSDRILIRSGARPGPLVSSVRSALAGVRPGIRYSFHFFDQWIQDSLLRERLMAMLSGLFGALAVMLAVVGLYGVVSYTVARRTNEIGIRIALGASRQAVVALILREAAVLLAAGLSAGTILSLAVGRFAAAFLFGLEPHDPLTLAGAGIAIAVVAAAASYLPARRASSLNPVIALRQE
jgi:predicted permease